MNKSKLDISSLVSSYTGHHTAYRILTIKSVIPSVISCSKSCSKNSDFRESIRNLSPFNQIVGSYCRIRFKWGPLVKSSFRVRGRCGTIGTTTPLVVHPTRISHISSSKDTLRMQLAYYRRYIYIQVSRRRGQELGAAVRAARVSSRNNNHKPVSNISCRCLVA